MRLVIRSDFCGNDLDRLAEYALKLGTKDIMTFPRIQACYDDNGFMRAEKLALYKSQIEDRGLLLSILSETLTEQDLSSKKSADDKAERLSSTIRTMGELGMDLLFVFLSISCSDDSSEQEALWQTLSSVYHRIVPVAEKAGVRLANHGHQQEGFLIWSCEEMNRLLQAVPSDCNGVTLCTGCYHLAGDNLTEVMRRFGKKICLVHARDVTRTKEGSEDVMYGQGEVDVIGMLRQLQDIGYTGFVCPEHLAPIDYEPYDEISGAWGLGYLAGVARMLRD
jgi:D-mannonate dehydratase